MTGPFPDGRPSSTVEDGRPVRAGRPRAVRRWAGASALSLGVALLAGGVTALLAAPAPRPVHTKEVGTVPVHADAGPGTRAPGGGTSPRPVAAPTRVRIASISLDQPLTGLRVQQDGHLAVPADPAQVGWWSDGPRPGDPGAAVLVGHLDSARGPAAFYNVSALRPGDRVAVDRGDGTTVEFVVRALRQYEKDAVPDSQVYATTGPPSLRLITCGGAYDGAQRGYRDNLVVFATLAH